MRSLFPHQKIALNWANSLDKIALFMEMRLGKTLVVMRWAENKGCRKILVLAPKSVLPVWEDELQKERWADSQIAVLLKGTQKRLEQARKSQATWILTNYETVTSVQAILNIGWECVILDESTKIKNPKARITKILNKNTDRIPYKAILTGLPDPEGMKDFFEQMRFLHGNFMGHSNFWTWRRCYFYKVKFDFIPRKGAKKAILEALTHSAFTLTAKAAGIGNKKIYEKRFVELTSAQKKMYKQINTNFEYETKDGEYKMTRYIPVNLEWMCRVCGGFAPNGDYLDNSKFKEILSLLRGELKRKSVVIWFKYTLEMEKAKAFLNKHKIKCAFYNSHAKELEAEFKKGSVKVMLAQAKCGQYGLNWSVASTAIYCSNWWSGEVRAQTEKRIEHPSKKKPLLYIDIVCKDTVDEDVLKALKMKHKTSRRFSRNLINIWRKRNGLCNSGSWVERDRVGSMDGRLGALGPRGIEAG